MELKAFLTIADFCSAALLFSFKKSQNNPKQNKTAAFFREEKFPNLNLYPAPLLFWVCSVLEQYSKEANDWDLNWLGLKS